MNYYIGIDLGTSSCKGVIVDKEGHIYNTHSFRYSINTPAEGFCEQNPQDWLDATEEILKTLTEALSRDLGKDISKDIKGIGIAGQMHGLVMLDENDKVIRPAILWNDGRSTEETDYLNSIEDTFAETGNMAFPGFTAPKILWVKKHEPENFKRCRRICLPKDYLAYMLTGVFSTDYSDAAGMLLLDVKNKRWSDTMCKICGITADMLPKLFESYEATGALKDKYKLPNAVLCAGSGDNAASAVGTGTLNEGDCSISLGTSGTVFLPSDEFHAEAGRTLHNFCHSSGRYHLMGCILSAASCVDWWTINIQKNEYDSFTLERAGKTGLFFLPYLRGERCPHNDVNVRGAFLGLSANTTPEDMSLAVCEGVAYALRDCIEAGHVTINSAVLCGGGAKSKLWQNIIANVLGVDIYLTDEEQFGAAILAMTACHEYDSLALAVSHTVKKHLAVKYDRSMHEIYNAGFTKFRKGYSLLSML